MTNKEKAQMFEMRLDGYTLQAIADKFGVTKQYVSTILPPMKQGYKATPSKTLKIIKYPNIEKWMRQNQCNMKRLSGLTGLGVVRIRRGLCCEFDMHKSTIDKILEVTGMTYEEAFHIDT